MRILVTGGAGFIGSHLADAFCDDGHHVAVVDNLSTGRRSHVPAAAELHVLDIRDPALERLFRSFRPDVLCHQAAQMDVRRSVSDPVFDADVNVVGTLRLLELCRRFDCERVLFASTGGAIYGEQDEVPAREDHPQRPVSPYGVAKLAGEKYLHFYAIEYGVRATATRYANVYGPRQSPHGEAGVVAIFTDRMVRGEAPTIYGDGEQTRDFIYVADVVEANRAVLAHDLSGAYNVGTGVETSINELYATLRDTVGRSLEAVRAPGLPGEQRRSCITSRALTLATGWTPTIALHEGVSRTVAHVRGGSAE